jgi:hypothetical protein
MMATASLAEPTTAHTTRILDTRLGTCTLLAVCVLFIAGVKGQTYTGPIRGDQTTWAIVAHEMLNGRRLYSDLWDHKPPAIHLTYALGELLVGYGTHQVYLLYMVGSTLTLLGLYHAGSLLGGRRAGSGAAMMWALMAIFPHWEGFQPNAELFLNALTVWAYYFLCRLNSTGRWWLACAFGALVGAASLYKQVVIAPAALMGCVYIWTSGRGIKDRLPAVRDMLVAAGVASSFWVACWAWFWSQGDAGDYYDAVFIYNRHYTGNMLLHLVQARHWRLRSYLLGVVIPCVLVPLAGPRLGRAPAQAWLFLAAYAVGCFIEWAVPGRWTEYYLEVWMPVYALAGGAVVAGLTSGQIERPRLWRWALLAMVFGPLAIHLVRPNQYRAAPWRAYEPGSDEYDFRYSAREAGLALKQLLLPGERMYALGTPGQSGPLYFYTRQSPQSGVYWDFPLRPGKPLAGKLEDRIVRDLDRDPPDLFVSSRTSCLGDTNHDKEQWGTRLRDWVFARYSPCGLDVTKKYLLYARRGSAIERRLAGRESS